MWTCWGLCKPSRGDEQEPLLPVYEDDTTLQRQLHEKLHTYQMLRALSNGYMPSNEQLIINLRTLLSSDVLNPQNPDLSDAGRTLVVESKQWLRAFIELLQHKDSDDQVQDFIWFLVRAKLSMDGSHLASVASHAIPSRPRADARTAYNAIQTIGSLLLTNSDFRIFLSDLNTVVREVLRDATVTLSDVSKEAGKQIEPSKDEEQAVKEPGGSGPRAVPSKDDLQAETTEVYGVLSDSAGRVVEGVEESLADKVTGSEKDSLLYRLKKVVTNLRKRQDYTESVSMLSNLVQRCAISYSHLGMELIDTLEEDVQANAAADEALRNFWGFLRSFGNKADWDQVETRAAAVLKHTRNDTEFDRLLQQIGSLVQDMLLNPDFFDNAEGGFKDLRSKVRELASESSLQEDIDGFLERLSEALRSVVQDQDVAKLTGITKKISNTLSPSGQYVNGDLLADTISVFTPLAIQAIQYIPIPRLEISTPDADLLFENLVLEPGVTINNSSFLPHKFRVETQNSLEIRKARFRTASSLESNVLLKFAGISVKAEEVGFWLRTHAGLLWLADEGIASFYLDERGIDVELDIEIAKDRLEQILTLHAVRVKIHKLSYTLRKSKFALFAWLIKPILQPIIRKTLEVYIAAAIEESLRWANRELLYARERLRATRIANPDDLGIFIKAVTARLAPEDDADTQMRLAVEEPGRGVFKGVYAPGSIVKLWHEEAVQAANKTQEYAKDGWRNDIFDVLISPAY